MSPKYAYRLIVRCECMDECNLCVYSVVIPKADQYKCITVDSAYFWLRSNPAHWNSQANMDVVYTVTLLRYTEGERYPKCIGRIKIHHSDETRMNMITACTFQTITGGKLD